MSILSKALAKPGVRRVTRAILNGVHKAHLKGLFEAIEDSVARVNRAYSDAATQQQIADGALKTLTDAVRAAEVRRDDVYKRSTLLAEAVNRAEGTVQDTLEAEIAELNFRGQHA